MLGADEKTRGCGRVAGSIPAALPIRTAGPPITGIEPFTALVEQVMTRERLGATSVLGRRQPRLAPRLDRSRDDLNRLLAKIAA